MIDGIYCPVCNKIVKFQIINKRKKFIYEDKTIEYDGKECLCNNCNESLFNGFVIEFNIKQVKEKIINEEKINNETM